ncbi:MAG: acylphosphatase [Bacteroidales bacterium]|nr:acylphosphatase [Bacteroidales bacterium]
MKKAVILNISGRVQNVGFRYHTRKTAQKLNISGFVKNQTNGSVYVEAEGEEENLDQFIIWCKSGPSWARVDNVSIQPLPNQWFVGFEIR